MVSGRERVAHVVRRLSMGVHPDVVAEAADVDSAIARALDRRAPAPVVPVPEPPAARDPALDRRQAAELVGWWIEAMRHAPRLVEERLVWFWHDHFATSLTKVRVPSLMARQHVTIRAHAAGSFADLARAVTKDPAMLLYLDGASSSAARRNENYGREFLELFTMGRDGGYSQDDVVAASRAFTGWVVNIPGARLPVPAASPWDAVFVRQRWDAGPKTLLGRTGAFDADAAVDVVLGHPATPRHVVRKLYRALVGLEPSPATWERLSAAFGRDYAVLPLVESIVSDPAFTSDAAVRARVRTPVEKLVGMLQAVPVPAGARAAGARPAADVLRTLGYVPFVPPDVGGFPEGEALLTPHALVHAFDLVGALGGRPDRSVTDDVDALLARFGLFDVDDRTRQALAATTDPTARVALVVASPEYALS